METTNATETLEIEDNQESSKDCDSSESSSNDSNFEDAYDQGQSIADALRRNYELMKEREDFIMKQIHSTGQSTVVYDSNAELIR